MGGSRDRSALLSDAGHMVTDVAALSIAMFAQRLAQRPPSRRASYGYARAEVLAAFINALIMLALVVWIAIEAVRRLLAPAPVAGVVVIGVAAAGLGVNLVCAWLLSRSRSLNSRAALVHVLGDLAGSVAALVAGAVITATGWMPIDPLLSLFVAVLHSAFDLAAPQGIDRGADGGRARAPVVRRDRPALTRLPGVAAVHDLHVWHMTSDRPALSAHLLIRDPRKWPDTLAAAQARAGRPFRHRSRHAANRSGIRRRRTSASFR